MVALKGSLRAFDLPSLVRLLAEVGHSGALRLAHGPWAGEVTFDHGQAVAAAFGHERGLAALEAMALALHAGQFTFAAGEPAGGAPAGPDAPPIDLPAAELAAHLEGVLGPHGSQGGARRLAPTAVPRVVDAPGDTAAPTLTLTRGAVQTLLTVDGRRTVGAIVAERGLAETLRELALLADLGLIELAEAADAAGADDVRLALDRAGH